MTASTFGAGTHPDLPDTLVHLTGRPRSQQDDHPPAFAVGDAGDRLAGIAHVGAIYYTRVWGSRGPVVCMSEASPAALTTLFATGVTHRGPYAPWAVMINRVAAIAAGARPVWHMGDDALTATNSLPTYLADLRVRYVPGRVDWLAEREWRICWGDMPIAPNNVGALRLANLATGVIVGVHGWLPRPRQTQSGQLSFAYAVHGLARWWWNGERIVPDGIIDIAAQAATYGFAPPPTMR